ncbi:type III-B CRISPR module-associated Cmr3 family protein [Desulfothermobacter acidiphilus]|uniref:type III-B CRISPR module-associated Cmr3 family protein n=1 Tax=Desulfothermobacter acidiphilus TaxID=1938353 RepID=UPI003F8AA767
MNLWIIEPRDPLIVRDGRPFGPFPGARARSLDFPFPSTIAGAVRTRAGLDEKGFFQEDKEDKIEELKKIQVKGPLLVELDDRGEIACWLVLAPADALLLGSERELMLKRLVPLQLPEGAQTNLPDSLEWTVGLTRRDPRKPFGRAPRYWYWEFFERWLLAPGEDKVSLNELGHDGPVRESRMHVGIKPKTRTADEEKGALFQTQGLEFTSAREKLSGARRLGLAVATDASGLKPGLAPLGGERRLAFWRPSGKPLPPIPKELVQQIVKQRSCRLILLTPAYFEEGWKPSWLLEEREGVKPLLEAAALKRYETVSGWDLKERKPKPTRRLAPAGTVYFLRLEGEKAAVQRWVEKIWLECVSDGEQERRDGFGLAVLGTWDGNPQGMEV